jgi:cytochrome bd-type quinol oxidase subunit 2
MLDSTLPLTPIEWPEWGNPIEDKAAFEYIRSYSPYDQLRPGPYPPMLVTAGLNDPRVTYWEPAKYVAKLRTLKTDDSWLLLKTKGELHRKARRWTRRLAVAVAAAMFTVSVAMLSVDPTVSEIWGVSMRHVDFGTFIKVAPLPLLAIAGVIACWWYAGRQGSEAVPLLATVAVFLAGFLGLALSTYPYVIPFDITIHEAAAANNALGLMLVGVAIMLPVILGYTAYVYWVFRGKATADAAYH